MDFESTFKRNLGALQNRYPRAAKLLSSWKDRFEVAISPLKSGEFAVSTPDANGRRWLSEQGAPAEAAHEFARKNVPGAPEYSPLLLSGARAGYELAACFAVLHHEPGGRTQALYLVEPSPEVFKTAMRLQDLSPVFESEHFHGFIGPRAMLEIERFFNDDPMKPLPKSVTSLGDGEDARRLAQVVSGVLKNRVTRAVELKKRVDDYYNSLSARDWIDALSGEGGLRVLQISSGFSHFVQYANRDISEALRSLGHETRIIAERAPVDHITGPAMLAAIDEFRPHIIHHIDHARFEAKAIYPEKLIFLTSMLDYFPALETPEKAALAGPWDYFCGYVGHWEARGYRHDRLLPQEPMVNARVFRPVELSNGERRRYECDASYLSNISKTPEQYLHQAVQEIGDGDSAVKRIAWKFYEEVEKSFGDGRILYRERDYAEIFRGIGGEDALPSDRAGALVFSFFHTVGNAFFRQIPLVALSDAGVDLRLYGRGWEDHPRLAKHARGLVEHGEETNLILNATRVNLHINQYSIRHNRLCEGYAAGAFFLVHRHHDATRFELDGVLFEGKKNLVELMRKFLMDADARHASAERNRAVALEHHGYGTQYERALHRLRVCMGSTLLLGIVDEAVESAIADGNEPLCEQIGRRPLGEVLANLAAGATESTARVFDGGDAEDEAQVRLDFHRNTLHALSRADATAARGSETHGDAEKAARFAVSAIRVHPEDEDLRNLVKRNAAPDGPAAQNARNRVLHRAADISITCKGIPFGCAASPDGRVAFVDWPGIGKTDENTVLMADPINGRLEEFATGKGIQRGSFGPDGSYYAQVLGQDGVFRLDGRFKEKEKIVPTGPGTPYKIILETIVRPDGRLLLYDWDNSSIALHHADGRFDRRLLSAGQYPQLRGFSLAGDKLHFTSSDKLYTVSLDGKGEAVPYPDPLYGFYDYTAASPDGLFATLAHYFRNHQGKRGRAIVGLTALSPSGETRFLSLSNPFISHTICLCVPHSEKGCWRALTVSPAN